MFGREDIRQLVSTVTKIDWEALKKMLKKSSARLVERAELSGSDD
jgi:hypothetical protein